VALVLGMRFFPRERETPPARFQARIAVPVFQSSALVLLADHLGYFREEGVDARFEYRPTGRECLDLALKGQADFAVVYETPVVHAALAGNRISILTELHRSEGNTAVVARKDRGIRDATSLRGKTIATVPKTNAEFLLDLYLRSHLIDSSAVRVVPMTVLQAVEAVQKGRVDAAALWEPYVSTAISLDPGSFERLRSSYYSEFSVLAARRDQVDALSEETGAVLRALGNAGAFYQRDPRRAQSVVDGLLRNRNVLPSELAWKDIDIHLGMSATLLTMLNQEARWYGHRRASTRRLDLKPLLQAQYLRDVAPQWVTFE
jgi:ABC-type nitrate/sulfonate/bicarbonate transport system substrate-binding protein